MLSLRMDLDIQTIGHDSTLVHAPNMKGSAIREYRPTHEGPTQSSGHFKAPSPPYEDEYNRIRF